MEFFTLVAFCTGLLLCLMLNLSILYALTTGLILFWIYGKKQGFSWIELAHMALSGIKTVKNILITFLLIGMLTALWREAGTIPVIVCYATRLIRPSIFLLMTFLLNCLISVLTGTSFGTAATMGVICATMASTMQVSPMLVGGAVLSGAFFGDRCSPVSTSALLVAELTGTSIFQNIKRMLRSAVVPFLITCGIYLLIGLLSGTSGEVPDLQGLFRREFALHWSALLPAVVILVLSLLQVNVKIAMTASILTALPVCLFVQNTSVTELPALLLAGYQAADPEVGVMVNGGGILSMVRVAAIVCLSSSYSGIFQKTKLLTGIKNAIQRLGQQTTPFAALLCTSVVGGMISCNQTLTIILCKQLCGGNADGSNLTNRTNADAANSSCVPSLYPSTTQLALDLEDSAVVVAPLIPWSIAGAVPLASVGAPLSSMFFACFLYLLPMWRLIVSFIEKKRLRKG